MKKIIPNLYFLFLTSPILSPYVLGITFYFSTIIVFLDPIFYKWLQKNTTSKKLNEVVFLLLLMLVCTRSPILILKIIMLLLSGTYGYYCYVSNKFYLYRWITLNILIAILQFIFIFVNMDIARLIGPTNIANTIWGNFAGPTLTNFYAISILPRVSGLSREGGFFAALLSVNFFLFLYDDRKSKRWRTFYYIIFSIGLIISLSKTSLIVLLVPIIWSLKRYINLLRIWGVIIFYVFFTTIVCYLIDKNTKFFTDPDNITFLLRFGGYIYAPYAQIMDFIVGIKLPDLLITSGHVSRDIVNTVIEQNSLEYCGLPFFYLGYNILSFIVFILFLIILGFDGTATALLIILTTNVHPITNDGFVVLAWILGYILSHRIKSKISHKTQFLASPVIELN